MPSAATAVMARDTRLPGRAAALTVLLPAAPVQTRTAPQEEPAVSQAQPTAVEPRVDAQPSGPAGLRPDGRYLEADSITEDETTGTIPATGSVQARYEGRLLRADRVDYQTETGLLSAQGNAELINPDGTVQYADTIELDDELR